MAGTHRSDSGASVRLRAVGIPSVHGGEDVNCPYASRTIPLVPGANGPTVAAISGRGLYPLSAHFFGEVALML